MSDIILPPWPWDSPPRALVRSCSERLAAQFASGPVYLLVDPHLGDPPEIEPDEAMAREWPGGTRRAREAVWKRSVHTLHSSQNSRATEAEFPYLVQLDSGTDAWMATSVEWAMQEHLNCCAIGTGPYRIGGWLQPHSADDGPALARQLRTLTQYTDSAGERRLVRLFDRRVLHTLHRSTQTDWTRVLQGIARWSYLDHGFTLQTLQGHPGEPNAKPLVHRGYGHLDVLNRTHALHLAQSTWLRTTFPLPDDAFDRLMRKVKAAEHQGLVYPADQAAYAAEAVVEPAFEHWPKLRQLLDIVAHTRQELSDALNFLRPNWAGKAPDHWTAQGTV